MTPQQMQQQVPSLGTPSSLISNMTPQKLYFGSPSPKLEEGLEEDDVIMEDHEVISLRDPFTMARIFTLQRVKNVHIASVLT